MVNDSITNLSTSKIDKQIANLRMVRMLILPIYQVFCIRAHFFRYPRPGYITIENIIKYCLIETKWLVYINVEVSESKKFIKFDIMSNCQSANPETSHLICLVKKQYHRKTVV